MGAANNVQLIGRITKDVEVRKSSHEGGQAAASFTLAVDRDVPKHRSEGQQNSAPTADFISCAAFGARAEALANYTAKGSLLAVHGHIQTRTYKSSEGRTIYVTEVVCDSIRFLETASGSWKQRDRARTSRHQAVRLVPIHSVLSVQKQRMYLTAADPMKESEAEAISLTLDPLLLQEAPERVIRALRKAAAGEATARIPGDSSRSTGAKDPYPAYPSGFENDDCPF